MKPFLHSLYSALLGYGKANCLFTALLCAGFSGHCHAQIIHIEPLSVLTKIGIVILGVGVFWAFILRQRLGDLAKGVGVGWFGMAFIGPDFKEYMGYSYSWCVAIVIGVICWLLALYLDRYEGAEGVLYE